MGLHFCRVGPLRLPQGEEGENALQGCGPRQHAQRAKNNTTGPRLRTGHWRSPQAAPGNVHPALRTGQAGREGQLPGRAGGKALRLPRRRGAAQGAQLKGVRRGFALPEGWALDSKCVMRLPEHEAGSGAQS